MAQSLWPDDLFRPETDIPSPVAILREQGSILGDMTRNVIEVEVKRIDPPMRLLDSTDIFAILSEVLEKAQLEREDRYLYYAFYLVAPLLGNYRYRLFTIAHSIIRLYPLVIVSLDEEIQKEISSVEPGDPVRLDDETQFKDFLSRIFSATKTRRIINAMLAQSKN